MSKSLSEELFDARAAIVSGACNAGGNDLEGLLRALIDSARTAWPTLVLDERAFAAFLGTKLSRSADATGALRALRTNDLYLAFGCSLGNAGAIAHFEAAYRTIIDGPLKRILRSEALIEEVRQQLRVKLFSGDPERPSKIVEYSGTGDLASWLRAVAMRQALNVLRDEGREIPSGDVPLEAIVLPSVDRELDHFKAQYLKEFRAAFKEAFGALAPHDRTILRQHFLDGLTLAQVAGLLGLNRSTATRRIAKAKADLLERTREIMMRRLQVTQSEVESVIRLIESRLEVSAGTLQSDASDTE